jgi:iron complex outermembrane receptor protein
LVNGEVGIEGAVFDLPAGQLRLAAGGGYRSNRMINERAQTGFNPATVIRSDFTASRDSYYGFGEIQAPLVAPAQGIRFVHRLTFTGALRYEDYPGIASLATPKLGLVYAPSADVDLKASWGKSFKAPTLYQQFVRSNVYLFRASNYGAGYPAGATVLGIDGGNRMLEPERATSWTGTVSVHPRIVPGLSIDIGYFRVDYRARIAQPLASTSGALANPAYASFVTVTPSAAQIADALALAPGALINNAGGVYDPAAVIGIVDNRFRNVARQISKGVDVAAMYNATLGDVGDIALTASGTWLSSRRQLIEGEAQARLAGLIFNPAGFRGRLGSSLTRGRTTVSAFVNRTSGVDDERRLPVLHVDGQTTMDATIRFALGQDAGRLRGLELVAAVTNAFDTEPAQIRTSSNYYPPYDSTNYSAVGRIVSLTISKAW